MDNKELIWVPKGMKEIIEKMDSDQEKLKIVDEYINNRKLDITYSIEALDDDLLRFKAFSLKYKTELQKVYEEQGDKLEKLFEDCGDIQSKMYHKIKETKDKLDPIVSKINSINGTSVAYGKVSSWMAISDAYYMESGTIAINTED